MFLDGDITSKVLVVLVDLRRFLAHLGQLRLDRGVLGDRSLGGVDHRPVCGFAEFPRRLVHALNHLPLHAAVKTRNTVGVTSSWWRPEMEPGQDF